MSIIAAPRFDRTGRAKKGLVGRRNMGRQKATLQNVKSITSSGPGWARAGYFGESGWPHTQFGHHS